MNISIFFFFFVAVSSALFSSQSSGHATPNDEAKALLALADSKLNELNEKINIFLEQKEEHIKSNEVFLKEIKAWEEAVEENHEFKNSIMKLKEDFLLFRDSLRSAVGGIHGPCPYSRFLQARTVLETTEWFSNYFVNLVLLEKSENKDKNFETLEKDI